LTAGRCKSGNQWQNAILEAFEQPSGVVLAIFSLSNNLIGFGPFPARCGCRFQLMPSQRSHHA
jgi:hypothetical protein